MTNLRKHNILFKSMICEIDVRGCVARKKYTGELSLEYEADNSLIDIPYVTFASPVKAALRYEIFEDDSVEVKGVIAFTLKGLCSRCLSETERQFEGEVDAVFVPNLKEEGDEYGYSNGRVKLDEALRDALLFALPARLECENACELPEWE